MDEANRFGARFSGETGGHLRPHLRLVADRPGCLGGAELLHGGPQVLAAGVDEGFGTGHVVAIQTETQFETWCMYDGKNAEELAWWNYQCHVPFNEVRPVTQWRRESGLALEDGEAIHWVRGTRPAGQRSETFAAGLSEAAEHPDAKCLRIYVDDERGHVYAALAARDSASAAALADAMGLPREQIDVVDEIRPTDFAPLYENVGFTPYSGDD
jgi:hypothetical protein